MIIVEKVPKKTLTFISFQGLCNNECYQKYCNFPYANVYDHTTRNIPVLV